MSKFFVTFDFITICIKFIQLSETGKEPPS